MIRLSICAVVLFGALLTSAGATAAPQADSDVQSELIFPLNAQHNHAPGIAELANGDLVASWYRGSGERTADDVMVYGSRLKKGTREWSKEFVMADTPGFPDCNTAMMTDKDGRLFLFWPVIIANSWESCLTHVRIAEKPEGTDCPKWTSDETILLKPDDFSAEAIAALEQLLKVLPKLPEKEMAEIETAKVKLKDKLYQRLGWQPRCKPTVLPSGRILLPLYTDTFSISIMAISDDGGKSWFAGKPMFGFGAIQPAVLRRNDGTLVAYMRENGFTQHVRVSESADDGITWGPVTSSTLPNPGSGLDGVRLKNGHWVLIYNDTTEGRNRLAVSVSTDEGQSWSATRHLEDHPKGSYHYPCIIQTSDDSIHAVYSYFVDGGKSMKHASFDEAWITQPGK